MICMRLFLHPRLSYRICRYGLLLICLSFQANAAKTERPFPIEHFMTLVTGNALKQERAGIFIENHWKDSYTVMILETMTLVRNPNVHDRLVKLLQNKTGQDFGYNISRWFQWVWPQEYQPHSEYREFKSKLYGLIDPKFEGYFSPQRKLDIRLDEVR